MLFTLFTPTYNRAHLLPRLYESLKAQTYTDFEWLIVDDGSSDNTAQVVERFVADGRIDIRYVQKPNGGKHTAINRGVKEARGQLFWIIDSDDSLPPHAVATLAGHYQHLPQMAAGEKLGGICGYMAHHDGTPIGQPRVESPIVVNTTDMRHRLGVTGDMMEVFYTEVLRQFPFPEIAGERFCPEVLVWSRIAQQYPLLLVPEVIYYRDYLDGGLTDNIVRIRRQSPVASMMNYAEQFALPIPCTQRIKAAINYWRFAFCARHRSVGIGSWGKLLLPLGWMMHLRDNRREQQRNPR
ncbi:MAG: glycosyltransferase family 2 protein [Bacteroidaceae bacterium]|nr:glycosyltransferase family 2 protein [Bacteroidaceae bacterium]